jgi:site-specific DNA-methyltransferase (adenine-specific)
MSISIQPQTSIPLLSAFTQTRRHDCAALVGKIVCCDALELLAVLPDNSVDCVVTSPPYNMRNDVHAAFRSGMPKARNWNNSLLLVEGYGVHDDNMPTDEYNAWQHNVLIECLRVVKSTGAIFYNHKWRIQNSLLDMRNAIVDGLPVRQVIIWNRGGGNNHNRRFFVPSYEVIYMIAKPDFFVSREGATWGDVWHVAPEFNNPHPAPYPIEIPERCIIAGCPENGIVFDPFMGSGTTAVAARNLGRKFIGCDLSPEYVELANRRLMNTDAYQPTTFADGTKQLSLFSALESVAS